MRIRSATSSIGCALTLVALGFLALETARMDLPPDFASTTQRIAASGFGGRNKGKYTLGEFSGEFTRTESRLGVFDPLYASKRGSSTFTVQGPGFDSPVSGACKMREGTVTVGVVTFDPKKMVYQCDFNHGNELAAGRFALGQPARESMKSRMLAKAERRGEALINGALFSVRSVHNFEGGRWQSPTPVGYLLDFEDSVVAAVELTDVNPTVYLSDTASPELRHPVIIVLLALSVLRDPAECALDD